MEPKTAGNTYGISVASVEGAQKLSRDSDSHTSAVAERGGMRPKEAMREKSSIDAVFKGQVGARLLKEEDIVSIQEC